jgi:hypothetical protein
MSDDFDSVYGTRFISAADLGGRQKRVQIADVSVEELRQKDGSTKRKYVLSFNGGGKNLVLIKTNATRLVEAFGKPRDLKDARKKWGNQVVDLYVEPTAFGDGVRLRPLVEDPAEMDVT